MYIITKLFLYGGCKKSHDTFKLSLYPIFKVIHVKSFITPLEHLLFSVGLFDPLNINILISII